MDTYLTLTNVLLSILIGLLGFIGAKFYDKIEAIGMSIQRILLSDLEHKKDIEQLQVDREDHEKRIKEIEKELF